MKRNEPKRTTYREQDVTPARNSKWKDNRPCVPLYLPIVRDEWRTDEDHARDQNCRHEEREPESNDHGELALSNTRGSGMRGKEPPLERVGGWVQESAR